MVNDRTASAPAARSWTGSSIAGKPSWQPGGGGFKGHSSGGPSCRVGGNEAGDRAFSQICGAETACWGDCHHAGSGSFWWRAISLWHTKGLSCHACSVRACYARNVAAGGGVCTTGACRTARWHAASATRVYAAAAEFLYSPASSHEIAPRWGHDIELRTAAEGQSRRRGRAYVPGHHRRRSASLYDRSRQPVRRAVGAGVARAVAVTGYSGACPIGRRSRADSRVSA